MSNRIGEDGLLFMGPAKDAWEIGLLQKNGIVVIVDDNNIKVFDNNSNDLGGE